MKKLRYNCLVVIILLVTSNLFAQDYTDIFKKDQMGNLSLFLKSGFSVEKKQSGIYTDNVTYQKETEDNGLKDFLWYSIIYGENNFPNAVVITTSNVNVYETMLKHCREKNMEKYYNAEDESAKFDYCYTNPDFTFSFKTDLSEMKTIYSIIIRK